MTETIKQTQATMSLALYPDYLKKGDLSPDAFGSEVDQICQRIHDACKGFGTDEKKLLQAMGGMTLVQRCQVPIRYKVIAVTYVFLRL